jgi:cytoskeletal protein RodZ
MNTIGQILKASRVEQNIPLSLLENSTKIKKDFIIKIENEDWDNLPEFPVVSGFVKNIASALGLSVNNINAVLRRDYPPKKLRINPKPDIQNKFMWSPKLTFGVGISVLVLIVLSYLGFEYKKFMTAPDLGIIKPIENEVILKNSVKIEGKTTTDVSLTVNNQPITLDQDGGFLTEIDIAKDTKSLIFKAVSRSGKVTEKIINIKVE